VKTNEGATATFVVVGTSDAPLTLRYQWRRKGVPIANATNSVLTLNNVISDVDDGDYSAVLTDSIGTVTSAAGKLTVLLLPTILQPNPAGQWLQMTAVVGENITLSTQIRGTKPIFIRWRRFGTGGASILPSDRFVNVNTDFQVLNNISNLSAGAYTVIMTNSVGGSLGAARTNAILTVLADSNGNGIPDVWESTYFGSPTGADRDADSDGDGLSNRAEYLAGTDPTNKLSYLKVEQISPTGGALITFQAVSNRTYTVEYKDGLDAPAWARLTDVVARKVDWTATATDPAPGTNRYYRLVVPRRP